jgi:hypothetical protein
MARKRSRTFKDKDIKIRGGLDAITKIMSMAQKTGKRRLRDEQIKTGLTLSVGRVQKNVMLLRRKSDKCRFIHDNDSGDDIGPLHCDND